MILIKLTFNKFERNKKIRSLFTPSENYYEFIEDEEFKGKYCKEKLNKIIEYKKNHENNNRKFKLGSHYSIYILNNNYNIYFSHFLIDLKCIIYRRKNNLTLGKIYNKN